MRRFAIREVLVVVASMLVWSLGGQAWAQSSEPPVIAVFDDPVYVDTGGGRGDESDTVQASLTALGYTVMPFTGITKDAFEAALADADVLLLPKLQNDTVPELGDALPDKAVRAIRKFVSDGGGVIVHGGPRSATRRLQTFLNRVFDGFSVRVGSDEPPFIRTLASGTAFAGGPVNLSDFSRVGGLSTERLPSGSEVIYSDNKNTDAIVALMPFDSGQICYIGWDWKEAAPLGTLDGGWLDVLDRAVQEVTGTGPIPFAGGADLAGLDAAGQIFYTTDLATWTNIPGGLTSLVVGDFDNDGTDDLAGLNGGRIYYTTDLATWTRIPDQLSSLVSGDLE